MKKEEIRKLLHARLPLFFVNTHEEKRFERDVLFELAQEENMDINIWSNSAFVSYGKTTDNDSQEYIIKDIKTDLRQIPDLPNFIDKNILGKLDRDTIVIIKDPGIELQRLGIIRSLKEFVINPEYYDKEIMQSENESNSNPSSVYKPVFIIDATIQIPEMLEKYARIIDFDLPTFEEIVDNLNQWIDNFKDKNSILVKRLHKTIINKVADNLKGLTWQEIFGIFMYIYGELKNIKNDKDLISIVKKQKKELVRKSEFLEFIDQEELMDNVGGMDILKDWIQKRGLAFSEKAEKYGLIKPRGVLLTGVPGTGKSLICKAISSLWEVPLIRFDVGKLFNKMIGASEKNTRDVLRMVDAIGNCVLWIDELEKGMAGIHSSSHSDSGTTARVIGTILSWMQEKNNGAFIAATTNNISQLPPELLRKGRFSEIFFVSVPSITERKQIFEIHLKKQNRDIKKFNIEKLVEKSEGFTGAEIEEAIISAMFEAFSDKYRELDSEDILDELKKTVPLSKTMEDVLKGLYSQADQGTIRYASSKDYNIFKQRHIGFTPKKLPQIEVSE